jgi:hypothetical protein
VNGTPEELHDLHDAALVGIEFDWPSRSCLFHFRGAPAASLRNGFSMAFQGVTRLTATAGHSWGTSNAVLELRLDEPGEYTFVMQSGDQIVVSSRKGAVQDVAA